MTTARQLDLSDFQQMRSVLSATPGVLDALLRDLPTDLLHVDEGSSTWSPHVVIAHLISAERINWIHRLRVIFLDEDKRFRPFDREDMLKDARDRDIRVMLQEFKDLRSKNLAELDRFWSEKRDWSSRAIHPDFGDVTASQLLSTWAVHDLGHIGQISRVLAKHWKESIGPWEEFLSIVHWNGSADRR
jgi:uncharacterized damage-inducible protein DinB